MPRLKHLTAILLLGYSQSFPVYRLCDSRVLISPLKATMSTWLMKSEPDEYSLEDLERDGTGLWDGIRNYQARNFMRTMQPGDKAFFYYSSCKEPGIYGEMRIAGTAIPDPKAVDKSSKYYDAKTKDGDNPWLAVPVKLERRYRVPLLLPQIRTLPLGECRLTAKGNRLSLFPLEVEQVRVLEEALEEVNSSSSAQVESAVQSAESTIARDTTNKQSKNSRKQRKTTEEEPGNTRKRAKRE